MKKKIIIFAIIFIILCIIAGAILIVYNKNNSEPIIDYTNEADNEVFYQNFSDMLNAEDVNYQLKKQDVEKRIYISTIDTEGNPIKEAKYKLYDDNTDCIVSLSSNNNGESAIYNLENDKKYYIKQTETKEGFKLKNTIYDCTTTYKDEKFYIVVVNSKEEISKEDYDKIVEDYKNKKNTPSDGIKIYRIKSDNEIEEDSTEDIKKDTYTMLKGELRGLNLNFIKNVETKKESDDVEVSKIVVRISNAYILNYKIEKINDTNNSVELLNNKDKKTNKFLNGEEFYIKHNTKDDISNIEYKFNITFKYDEKIYKISKKVKL